MKGILISYLFVFLGTMLSTSQPVTYYNGIKDILNRNCVSCHNPEGVAPFSLRNLDEVKSHKGTILSVLTKGIMPPWRPDPDYTHFLKERILAPTDKQKIISWIQQGCQTGVLAHEQTGFENSAGENAGADIVLKLPFTIKVPANSIDTNIWVEVPYEIDKDTFVSSFQFVPGHNSGIHHVFINIENAVEVVSDSGAERTLDGMFWDGKSWHERSFSSKYMAFEGGWISGESDISMPPHIGWHIPKKGTLIYQLHYGPTSVPFNSTFQLRFGYAKDKIDRMLIAQKYGSQSGRQDPYPPLVIPPDSVMLFTLSAPLEFDCSIIAVGPHMHLLGKSFKAWLLKPDGDTVKLISIKNWDFNEQGFYFLPALLRAEKGDLVQYEVIMDNTADNIKNPNKPPRFVRAGNNTNEEMIQISLLLVSYRKGDEMLSAKKDN